MRHYRLGAHTKTDLKVHLVWIPKYRKAVLTGEVAIRVRDLIRQIAMEHEIAIISGKVACDHIHVLVSYRPHQDVSTIVQSRIFTNAALLLPASPKSINDEALPVSLNVQVSNSVCERFVPPTVYAFDVAPLPRK